MNKCTMKRGINPTNYMHIIGMGRERKTFFQFEKQETLQQIIIQEL